MTGYGRAQQSIHNREITVELRSVNHRYLDCSVRVPRVYSYLEEPVKARVQGAVGRGKVDVFVTIDASGADQVEIALNEPVLKGYLNIAASIRDQYGIRDDLTVTAVMRLPEVLNVTKAQEDTEQLQKDVLSVLDEALDGYQEMSRKEGLRLAQDIEKRAEFILQIVDKIEVRSPRCVEEYREKLEVRMREVLEDVTIDPQRILTEAAIFADKVAVTEETVRLRSHLAQLKEMLESGGTIGRKLDFLVQELNREANTIGSKANDMEMAQMVVDIKAEIEKIREQIQNIE